jgi:putative flippase GtrA
MWANNNAILQHSLTAGEAIRMNILIPSYEPDERLLQLVRQLQQNGSFQIVIVDDGSGDDYRSLFAEARRMGCIVLTHPVNIGKGRALKTGFTYLRNSGATGSIVCADSDGQHLPHDIIRIAGSVADHPGSIVLGSRRFTGKVPARSKFGNAATRLVYRFTTGKRIYDTQTGLRGYPPYMLDWLISVPGERFEYEMNVLLAAGSASYGIIEEPIETVYLNSNESSHFRPLADSARVYFPFLKFSAVSLISAIVDFLLVLLIHSVSASLLLSVWGARAASSALNYGLNRSLVFQNPGKSGAQRSMPKYFALVVLILILNYGLMLLLNELLNLPLPLAKIITEASLFLFSFWAQRSFVFKRRIALRAR